MVCKLYSTTLFYNIELDMCDRFIFQDNRWKKKALSVVPVKWGVDWIYENYTVLVNIHGGDGSVLIHHGGVEMGQGINTKVYLVV